MSGIIRVKNRASHTCKLLAMALPMAFAANTARADTLLEVAASSDQLTQFVAEMQAARLDDTLNRAASLTVFAPTNDAFRRLPIPMRDALMVDGARMKALLSYHIVPRRISDILAGGTYSSLIGWPLQIGGLQTMPVSLISDHRPARTGLRVNQRVNVVQALQAENGTLYLVDDVLMPYAAR